VQIAGAFKATNDGYTVKIVAAFTYEISAANCMQTCWICNSCKTIFHIVIYV